MKTVTFTEFRKNAFSMMDDVEKGNTFRILRHGKPVAELIHYHRNPQKYLHGKGQD